MSKLLKNHLLEKRPWGKFEQFVLNEKATVKILSVKAGEELSLQSHKKRTEVWVALDKGLKFEIGRKVVRPKVGEKVIVPKKTKHRISATKNARVLEIALGTFNEKDEVRYEDKYGRS